MKKIGIMSMQRIRNYGSFWQAYGLKKLLEENYNCNVEFIDFKPGQPVEDKKNEIEFNARFNKKDAILRKAYGVYFQVMYKYIWLPRYLNVSIKKNYLRNYDITVIGSDEVFNCTQSGDNIGFSKDLFGENRKNVISYAASFGFTTLERLRKFDLLDEVGKLLKNFKDISVRDGNSYKIVKELVGKEPSINLDPVLISDIDKIDVTRIKMKNYIVIYAYTGRISKDEKEYIKKFAKENKKKIISLGYYHDFVDRVIVCNPYKILSYIKGADYVITDTFHGTIFSIILKKRFVSLIRESNKEKLEDLLERLGLETRKLIRMDELNYIIKKDIDYEKINSMLKKEKKHTLDYLKSNLSEEDI